MIVMLPVLLPRKRTLGARASERLTLGANHVVSRVARAGHADVATVLGALPVGGDLAVWTTACVQITFVRQRVEVAPGVVA